VSSGGLHAGSAVTLAGGVEMPRLGLGLYAARGAELDRAVAAALEVGYRHLDTASVYGNERRLGRALARAEIDRTALFVTTKVWNTEQGYRQTRESLEHSLQRLGMDYVDLFLVHWPHSALMEATWRALEDLLEAGKTRAIGVSNFLTHHLDRLAETAEVAPAVNQIEFHPHHQSPELRAACRERGIVVEAWSPLKRGGIVADPDLAPIARRHGVSAAQVALRWILQKGVVAIPKSVTPSRIAENADLFGFHLDDDDMAAIDRLDRGSRLGPDPDRFAG
jgi:diketogulonate reductase-like aldo/keto reductase